MKKNVADEFMTQPQWTLKGLYLEVYIYKL